METVARLKDKLRGDQKSIARINLLLNTPGAVSYMESQALKKDLIRFKKRVESTKADIAKLEADG